MEPSVRKKKKKRIGSPYTRRDERKASKGNDRFDPFGSLSFLSFSQGNQSRESECHPKGRGSMGKLRKGKKRGWDGFLSLLFRIHRVRSCSFLPFQSRNRKGRLHRSFRGYNLFFYPKEIVAAAAIIRIEANEASNREKGAPIEIASVLAR